MIYTLYYDANDNYGKNEHFINKLYRFFTPNQMSIVSDQALVLLGSKLI